MPSFWKYWLVLKVTLLYHFGGLSRDSKCKTWFSNCQRLPSLPLSIVRPIATSPADISSESRDTSGLRMMDGAVACAARMRARFVTDFDPGIVTVASTGLLPRKGAGQSGCGEVMPKVYPALLRLRLRICAEDMRWRRARKKLSLSST
jgi:hypothetical protein